MRITYNLCLLLCLLTVLLGGCGQKDPAAGSKPASETSSDGQDAGSPAPVSFEARTLDGTSVSADLFADTKLTMVNVWATYCGPCLNEMPGLGELPALYAPEDFQLIGIISDVTEDADDTILQNAAELVEQTGAGYSHLLLNDSLYTALLTDVSAVPTTFFIDQNGQILDTVIGAMDRSAWEEKINALLEQ